MIDSQRYPRLARIDSPADLRRFPESELGDIARELRAYLIESVATSGGHFGANLGVIELTVALHWLYETPRDRLVWDVGHQCYPHKILTGRRDRITTVKKKDGVAPFPRREESEYDAFGVGHSSTSISAALGMALASQRDEGQGGDARKIVAVIGDGAMTAGMAFEALNHGGADRSGHAGHPQRQPDVDQRERRRADADAGAPDGQPHAEPHPRRRQEDDEARRLLVALRQALGRARQRHVRAVDAVRGTRLPLHRPDRRPRPAAAGFDAAHAEGAEGPAAAARGHHQGQGLCAGRARADRVPRGRSVRPGRRRRQEGRRVEADLHRDLQRLAVRHGGGRSAPAGHHPGDARRLGPGGASPRNTRSATSTSVSPSSTPSRSPPAWPAKAPSRWWRSIRRSCSAPTTS